MEEMCGGNDCLFESNTIEHTNYECDDSVRKIPFCDHCCFENDQFTKTDSGQQ